MQAAAVAGAGTDDVADISVRSMLNGRIAPGSGSGSELGGTRRRLEDRSTSSRAGTSASANAAADVSVQSRFNEGAIKRTTFYVISMIGE